VRALAIIALTAWKGGAGIEPPDQREIIAKIHRQAGRFVRAIGRGQLADAGATVEVK